MELLQRIARSRSNKFFVPGWDFDDFWLSTIRDIRATLSSVRSHGGFANLCNRWRATTRSECLTELRELIVLLDEWKRELQLELPSAQLDEAYGLATFETASLAKAL
jgi:hypothetical protein